MKYPYVGRQTLEQWLMNTFTPSMWFRSKDCECCWEYMAVFKTEFDQTKGKWVNRHRNEYKLQWIVLAGCPRHD